MNYYNEIKKELINNEVYKKVKDYSKNKSDLNTYYNVGKILSEAGKHYGEGIIKEYSKRLTNDLGKGYNSSTLKRMRQFYHLIKKGAPMAHQLTWSHYQEIIVLKDYNEILYYINICMNNVITKRQLREKIKNKEYERLPRETRTKILFEEKLEAKDIVPNPVMIKNKSNHEIISEKVLQKLILEDIPSFLKELGDGFSFIDSEYKIKLGDRYNYIDILLFNYIYNCFIVVELKVTKLKKEHIGQIEVYMNYIDKNIKSINQDKTIGIIICKQDNRYIIKYCSDERIIARKYELI